MLGLVFYFLLFSYNVVRLLKIKTKNLARLGYPGFEHGSRGQECGALTVVLILRD